MGHASIKTPLTPPHPRARGKTQPGGGSQAGMAFLAEIEIGSHRMHDAQQGQQCPPEDHRPFTDANSPATGD